MTTRQALSALIGETVAVVVLALIAPWAWGHARLKARRSK